MENLQPVLAGCKGTTTDLTVFLSEKEHALFVYLGLALMERVDSDPNQFAYKMLVGRLVNAQTPLEELRRHFNHDPRTMKRWAQALKSTDPEEIVRLFSGRGGVPKVVSPMVRMVKMRYLQLRNRVRNYRQLIADEVKECFGETISRETLRQLFVIARKEQELAENQEDSDTLIEDSSGIIPVRPEHENSQNGTLDSAQSMANGCSIFDNSSLNNPADDNRSPGSMPSKSLERLGISPEEESTPERISGEVFFVPTDSGISLAADCKSEKNSRSRTSTCPGKPSSPTSEGLPYSGRVPGFQVHAIHHAGQILFSPWLDLISAERPRAYGLQSQWIGQILQGAVNIEQSHLICAASLGFFTGPMLVGLRDQRDKLKQMGTPEAVLDAYKANARLLPDGPETANVFYYDPHSKECSTQLQMLKGWCGRHHSITKVLHLDFIHTESGLPCFLQHYDNYYDLRERFFMTLSRFGGLFPNGSPAGSTFILDRGIFGREIFPRFCKHDCYLATWEKGYQADGWDEKQPGVIFQRFRERNHAGDRKEYSFECQEAPWPKDPGVRRIIVRATNPGGRMIEVSILCNNPDMDMKKIVTLMFNRWIQENNFKYLDRHFGLLQITGYASENYEDIANTLADRLVDSPEYLELKRKFAKAEQEFAKQLIKRERKTNQLKTLQDQDKIVSQSLVDRQGRIATLLKNLKVPGKSVKLKQLQGQLQELRVKEKYLKTKIKNHQKQLCALKEDIRKKNRCLEKLDAELDSTLRKQSRIQILIKACYQRPDIRKKAMMDAIRILAYNMFRAMVGLFRPIYNNYRNDHVMLRMLTHTDGFIWRSDQIIHIQLWLKGRYQSHQKKIFQSFIDKMNNFINGHFQGRAATVKIGLFDNASKLSEITQNHGVQIVQHTCQKD